MSVARSRETELKLLASDDGVLGEVWGWDRVGDWQVVDRSRERQSNLYYVARRPSGGEKVSLRWRTRAGSALGELTLKGGKLRDGAVFSATELTVTLPADRQPDLAPEGAELFQAAERVTGERPRPILRLETDRRVLELARADSRVELALDVVTSPTSDFEEHEIEAELIRGQRSDLVGLEQTLLATGRLRRARHGKRSRALRYLAGQSSVAEF